MAHVVKDTKWCVIDIDTIKGFIFFQQRWAYHWTVKASIPPLSAWTYKEKKAFHDKIDNLLWRIWSYRVHMKVNGISDFAKRFQGKKILINLDVKWVTKDEHWNVEVQKIPAGQFKTSSVDWTTRQIKLDSNDTIPRIGESMKGQVPVAHEFGHAIGNTTILGRGDEYKSTSPHVKDFDSIMNVGNQLRDRHFRTIRDELNKMILNTTLTVQGIT